MIVDRPGTPPVLYEYNVTGANCLSALHGSMGHIEVSIDKNSNPLMLMRFAIISGRSG